MKYSFPKINHIDDIRPAIEDSLEFIIAERDGYIVVNYFVTMSDTFPEVLDLSGNSEDISEEINRNNAIRRECRGIIFDKNGNILSRRLHKFFNVNERNETLMQNIDFSNPHVILEKLDGSMITPFYVGDEIRWGTKMGLTDVAKPVEEFVKLHPDYVEFADLHLQRNQTPIFEWCSRSQRIVVDYPDDRLVLIAIRQNDTGEYKSYAQMKTYAEAYKIECVKTYPGTAESMKHLIDSVRDQEDIEGYVLRFDDGHMVKIKGDWYVRIHKAKDAIILEKNVLGLIVNEKIDDVKSLILDSDRDRVEKYEKSFWEGIQTSVDYFDDLFNRFKITYENKRDFAIKCAPTLDSQTRTIMFQMFEGKNSRNIILDIIRKNLGTQPKVDSIRSLFHPAKWNYGTINE